MIQLGIFARTLQRASCEEVFSAAKTYGFECVQFNFACAGLPALPDSIDPELVSRIRSDLQQRGLSMAAVSGTCNLIHPDPLQRARNLTLVQTLIRICPLLRTSVVTLCTGTRDPQDMWRAHPDNQAPEAWSDLVRALEKLLPLAQECGVSLGVEPEPANVIDCAPKARQLLDELRSPNLKIVLDAANLLPASRLPSQDQTLAEGFDLLGGDIVLAHAKDLAPNASATVAAGLGVVHYDVFLTLLDKAGFQGPLILHSLTESEVPAAVSFLREHLARLPVNRSHT